jgi:hypothetical protein
VYAKTVKFAWEHRMVCYYGPGGGGRGRRQGCLRNLVLVGIL